MEPDDIPPHPVWDKDLWRGWTPRILAILIYPLIFGLLFGLGFERKMMWTG